ncbi:MAG: hypothetical protein HQL73_11475 [Magnetococcales bacterium]|nr:hypothetical protein [Magnetococcales bacterium]
MRTVVAMTVPHLAICAIRHIHPDLRHRPMAVVSDGYVIDQDGDARHLGVHPGMPVPKLPTSVVPCPRQPDAEVRLRRQIAQRLLGSTPLVEETRRGQWLVELSGTHRVHHTSDVETARRLLESLAVTLPLAPVAGIGGNPAVAVMARATARYTRVRWLRVIPGQEQRFFAHLPVTLLPGIGQALAKRLTRLGIDHMEDLVRCPETDLIRAFGQRARAWRTWGLGIDRTPVRSVPFVAEPLAVSFAPRLHEQKDPALRHGLQQACDQLGRQLRQENRFAVRLRLELVEWDDRRHDGVVRFDPPQDRTMVLFHALWEQLTRLRQRRVLVKRLSIRLEEQTTSRQLNLFTTADPLSSLARPGLDETLDAIRNRFGFKAIGYGRSSR